MTDYKSKNANRKLAKAEVAKMSKQDRKMANIAKSRRQLSFYDDMFHLPGCFGQFESEVWNELILGTTGKERL
jgi:anaerobic glycerol-3-phosphate dehydrogenase